MGRRPKLLGAVVGLGLTVCAAGTAFTTAYGADSLPRRVSVLNSGPAVAAIITANPPVRRIRVPVAGDPGPCGPERVGKSLAACLNQFIENKNDANALHFDIDAGDYLLTETIFLFRRDHVRFSGAGVDKTILRMDRSLEQTRSGKIDLVFTFNMIDSSWISLRDMTLIGSNLSGQRAVGVCPTSGAKVHHITLSGLKVSDFTSYVFIAGRAIPDQQLTQRALSGRAGPVRFRKYLDANPRSDACAGSVSDLQLRNSDIRLQNVAFYLVPYSSWGATENATPVNWRELADTARSGNQRFVVRGNRFTTDSEAVSSVIKVQGSGDLRIEGNTFDAAKFTRVFEHGAAINIAANLNNVIVRNNHIRFPANHQWPTQGLVVQSGFGRHDQFGVGANRIAVPAQNVNILENNFDYALIMVNDTCLCRPDRRCLSAFCDNMDAAQRDGREALDNIVITGNRRNGMEGQDQQLVARLCAINSRNWKWLDTVSCRENVSIKYGP